jgi:hypothetical protein
MSRCKSQLSLSRSLLVSASLVLVAIPGVACEQVMSTPQRLGHAEVKPNLNGIRAAQIAYQAVHGSYVEVTEPVPRTEAQLDTKTIAWPEGTNFDKLDWAPASNVAGVYWIELTNGGEGFIAHGLIDADGDGVPAHFTAARDEEAQAITSEGVF